MATDLDVIEAAIYEQSFRALDEQVRVIDALRARAGVLIAGVGVATAILGGLAGATRASAHGRIDSASWIAIGLFVAVLLLSLLVMSPRRNSVFSHDPNRLVRTYLDREPPISLSEYRRTITYYNGRNVAANARQLRSLFTTFAVASVCLACELVLWLWILVS